MPKRATAVKANAIIEQSEPIIDQYKKLEIECDKVIEKIIKRKARKSKTVAA